MEEVGNKEIIADTLVGRPQRHLHALYEIFAGKGGGGGRSEVTLAVGGRVLLVAGGGGGGGTCKGELHCPLRCTICSHMLEAVGGGGGGKDGYGCGQEGNLVGGGRGTFVLSKKNLFAVGFAFV